MATSKINLDISQVLNISCRRGDTVAIDITFRDTSNSNSIIPIDTGYDFHMQVRADESDDASDTPLLSDNSSGTSVYGNIDLDVTTSGTDGILKITIPDTAMRDIPAGRYKYDLQARQTASATTQTWVRGNIIVKEDVTHYAG